VALCDWVFLGRELPSRRSLAALLTIAAGASRAWPWRVWTTPTPR
jgi:hypothetical protein